MGKAITTAILHVAHPQKYGIWNSVSESTLIQLELWPDFSRGEPFGSRYGKINGQLLALAQALEIDLWTLDALWWIVSRPDELPGPLAKDVVQQVPQGQYFGLERHLHDFLYDNGDHTELG